MAVVEGIPPRVRSSIFTRHERVKDEQRIKREFIRCYGRSRGLYEYARDWRANHRKCVADDWRYVRGLLTQQGYETRVVVKILKQEGSGL